VPGLQYDNGLPSPKRFGDAENPDIPVPPTTPFVQQHKPEPPQYKNQGMPSIFDTPKIPKDNGFKQKKKARKSNQTPLKSILKK